MREKKKENRGITLIALVITIIVMLILVAVTIQVTISGGIFKKAREAIIETEIAREKEILNIASMTAKINNNWILSQEELQNELDSMTGNTDTKVEDMNDGSFLVVFPSKRAYEVKDDGSIEYLGKEGEIDKVAVIADKESDLSIKQVQEVEITIKNYNVKENKKVTVQYAWNTDETTAPSVYENAQFEDEEEDDDGNEEEISISRTTIIDSGDQTTGYYYLWIKVKVGNNVVEKIYGEYYIQEFMTLVNTSQETTAESGFLGNTEVPRGRIKSITIKSTRDGKKADEENCWDVGTKKEGIILAWYEEETGKDGQPCYKVTIGQEGGVVANANSTSLFRNIGSNLNEEITIEGLENLKTSNVIIMHSMFRESSGLKSLDVNGLDTSSANNMAFMFYGCSGLTELNLSNLYTNNVERMQSMFCSCKSLKELDLSLFNTSNVINMCQMFSGCEALKTLNIENFVTKNVTNMKYMFRNCSNLEKLDLKNFDTSKVTTMTAMFFGCKSLQDLNVSSFITSNVTSMLNMFWGCESLSELNVISFDTRRVTNMCQMFARCTVLSQLDLRNFNTENVTTMEGMFNGCSALKDLNVSSFDTSNVTGMSQMFRNCIALSSLDLSNFNTSNVTSMRLMFFGCTALTNLNLKGWTINNNSDADSTIFNSVPNNCTIWVSSEEMRTWVLKMKSTFTEVHVEKT